jgi:hypothetical protein
VTVRDVGTNQTYKSTSNTSELHQDDQDYTDDNEGSYAQQFSALYHMKECLRRHDARMSRARPCSRSDQAAIRGRIT